MTPDAARAQGTAAAEDAAKPRLTKPPKLVTFVSAEYPESEKTAGRTAAVVLEIGIAADGSVTDAVVVGSAGAAFDAAAVDAVKRFVFEPAEVNGKPAPIRIRYRYDFVFKEEAPAVASIQGVVRQKMDQKPLAGVEISLSDGSKTVTDADGRFRFENLTPGKRVVRISRADLKSVQTEESLEAGKEIEAVYELELVPETPEAAEESDDLEIVIVAPKLTKQAVSTRVEANQARRVAGTQGDVLKVVENLPGVARASVGSGQLVVWGASPQDTRVYVDGVRVPLLYHFGGLRSVIHTDLVRSVELVPGGYGSAYGRGLGGLVSVETRDSDVDRVHGSVDLNLLDASAAVQGPAGENNRFAIAARKSHLDAAYDPVLDDDVEEYISIPKYADAQARFRRDLSKTASVEATGLASWDEVSRSTSSADPSQRETETRTLDFQRISLRYRSVPGDGTTVEVIPWFGHDASSRLAEFGGIPTLVEQNSLLYGFRAAWTGPLGDTVNVSVGVDFEALDGTVRRRGSITSPPREGDANVFGQAPSDQVNVDEWHTFSASAAPFAELDIGLFDDKVHVVPGLRFDPYFTAIDKRVPTENGAPGVGAYLSDIAVEPRLAARWMPSRRVTFRAAFGRYRQPQQAEDLSSVFGNPLLGPSSAEHWLGGARFDLPWLLALETTVFYSRSRELAVRNPVPSPLVAEALVESGEGRSFGAQFLVRRELADGFFGWVAYTILRSERLDGPDEAWRLFDFDQTHVLTALAAYDLGAGFDISARARATSGYPRTPVVGSYYDARRGVYEPVLGEANSTRLDAFFALDVRVAKKFKIGSTELEAYLDVQNVTNRANPEELAYSPDYSETRPIRGLPILPVIGARWVY
jgi:TonB family protein